MNITKISPKFSIQSAATLATLIAALSSTAAIAADADGASAGALEEVLVTARKRSESLQETPVAVTVLSAAFIDDNDLRRPEDLARLTPGFHYEESGARYFNKPTIRGTSVNSVSYRLQKTSVYVDGVVVTGSFGSIPFNDLKQVEVLKGPQSTAFGRGNLAGAISYITQDPSNEFSGDVSVQGRTDNEQHYDLFLSGPIVGDTLGGTLSANYYNYGGPSEWKNTLFGDQLGGERSHDIAAKLVWKPTDWLTFKVRNFYGYDRDGIPTFQYMNPAQRTGDFTTAISLAASGGRTLVPVGATLPSNLPYVAATNQMQYPGLRRFTKRLTGSGDADLNFATLSLVAAHNTLTETEQYPSLEGLGFPTIPQAFALTNPPPPNGPIAYGQPGFDANQAPIVEDYTDTQAELRLTSNGDTRLKYVVGVNYFKFHQYENYTGFAFVTDYFIKNTSVFGLLSYKITDKLTASVEGRQAKDVISQASTTFGILLNPRDATYNRFLPRISANYQFTPDIMVYGLVSKGNSPGSFNTNAGLHAAAPQYDNIKEELLTNYELGIKTTWLDRRLLANLTVYHMDWKDQQLLVVIPYPNLSYSPLAAPGTTNSQQFLTGQFNTNAGSSKLDGFELEVEARPTEHFTVRGTLAYVNAKYKEFCSPQAWVLNPTPLPYPNYIGCSSVAGKTLFQQPPLTGSLMLGYTAPLTKEWEGFVNTDYSYVDKKYGSEINTNWTPASSIINLHFGAERKNLRFELFVMNLTDENSPVRTSLRFGGAAISGGSYTNNTFQQFIADTVPQKPRQFGASAKYSW